ncbi:MAG: adenylyl-sulfate kinase [Flavobacteriaceae bacterium]|nr:adenylyl-sulfate kinase [Flavobacteriaceae bacterium]MDG1961719.1 adenylyl-sulfate kinase [Flavobacteriaceae bacterium]
MKNIVRHDFHLDRQRRAQHKGHKGLVIWFTGLSGSGKSTLANALEQRLHQEGIHTYTLDGDNIRMGLNGDLGFAPEDRTENIRRIGHVADLMCDAGLVVLSAFVSPYRQDRNAIKDIVGPNDFVEVFVDTPLEVCEARDVKGLYAKAREGLIKDFTGVNAPYEAPLAADLVLDTSIVDIDTATQQLSALVAQHIKND